MFKAPNDIFRNWNKVCYIRPISDPLEDEYGNELPQYDEYQTYSFNYQPVKDEAELKAYGITSKGTVKAVVNCVEYEGKFKQYDLAYLYGTIPFNNCTDTNYLENKNYYVKSGNTFTKLIAGTDYVIGNAINKTVYEDENGAGENANYRVITFVPQNTKILVYFERLTKEEN